MSKGVPKLSVLSQRKLFKKLRHYLREKVFGLFVKFDIMIVILEPFLI